MSKPQNTSKVVEGVFAVNKPPDISSAQVIRNLQHHFNPSALFAPWIAAEQAFRQEEARTSRNRRKDKRVQVKIGHGGTLDPMATGVLIMGVGKGTKHLQGFLDCTKTYDATVLFGAATDTYDVLGKVLRRAEYGHVTRDRVEKALGDFKGKIMQRPPIYSALRIQGKRLYEYAREGKEVPREIEKRPVEVKELKIIDWMDGGTHKYSGPKEEAEEEAKDLAEKVLHLGEAVVASTNVDGSYGAKRKRPADADYDDDTSVATKKPALENKEANSETWMSGGLQSPSRRQSQFPEPTTPERSEGEAHPIPKLNSSSLNSGPPAVRLRMTVTSGFYVRSLSHDLGEAVGSLACMSELVRTRQGEFELGRNVLEYEEMDKGEETWGPKVKQLLEAWERGDQKVNGEAAGKKDEVEAEVIVKDTGSHRNDSH
ncbi:tRNA pseudouridine55 synthase, partial [Lecanoromycetidae sp. Uapishka_2]